MLNRFLKYYKPHMSLFILDLTVAALIICFINIYSYTIEKNPENVCSRTAYEAVVYHFGNYDCNYSR